MFSGGADETCIPLLIIAAKTSDHAANKGDHMLKSLAEAPKPRIQASAWKSRSQKKVRACVRACLLIGRASAHSHLRISMLYWVSAQSHLRVAILYRASAQSHS